MKDLKIRIFSALVLFGLFILASVNVFFFLLVFSGFLLGALWEWKIFAKKIDISLNSFFLLSGLLFFVFSFGVFYFELNFRFLFLGLSLVFIPIIIDLFRLKKNFVFPSIFYVFGFFYIAVSFSLMNFLVFYQKSSLFYWLFFGIIWTNDIMAYFIGSLIGKSHFVQNISPNKTLEGTLAGIFFGVIFSVIFWSFFKIFSFFEMIIFALIIGITAFLGDLLESAIKRFFSVKDSSNLIPGHGGLLDRFDSSIFAVWFAFAFYSLKFAL